MSFWKLVTEAIRRTGTVAIIATAGTFYVSFTIFSPIPESKTDVNDRFVTTDDKFDSIDAQSDTLGDRLDEQNEFLRMMIKRMEERPLNAEFWKQYDMNDTNRK